MENNSINAKGLVLGIVRAVVFLAGAITWFIVFAKLEVNLLIAKQTQVWSIFNCIDKGNDRLVLMCIIVLVVVILSFIVMLASSFLKGIVKGILPLSFSFLSLIVAFLVIGDVIAELPGDDIGAYVFIACNFAVIIISIIDMVLESKNGQQIPFTVPNDVNDGGYYGPVNEPETIMTKQKGSVVCLSGEYATCSFPISEGEILTMGKDPSACAIVFMENSQYISTIHCYVRLYNGRYEISDQSKNGVFVNGSPIPKGIWYRLADNTSFTLANSDNTFTVN